MKLVTLNCWGGRMHEPLLELVKNRAGKVDIFCFQEVFSTETFHEFSSGAKMNLYQDFVRLLPGYQAYFGVKSAGYDYSGYLGADIEFGNAMFFKENIKVLSCAELFEPVLHGKHVWNELAPQQAQLAEVEVGGKKLAVCNFHGLYKKDTVKKDIPERIEQSNDVRRALDSLQGEKILCGDFNLLPDGESIKILEHGMRNLVTEYGVTSTRSSVYTKPGKFADYILVSTDLHVENFAAVPDEVSDHLALELEFSI